MLSRLFHLLRQLSFRRRLVLGVTILHVLMMTVLVVDLFQRQHDFLHQQGQHHAENLALALAVSSSSWVMANDVVGLQELTTSVSQRINVHYVMVLSPDGRVLAHNDPTLVGLYVNDPVSRQLHQGEAELHTLVHSHLLEDVAAPIMAGKTLTGWARVGIGQEQIRSELRQTLAKSLLYILVGGLIAYVFARLTANWLASGIEQLGLGFKKVARGERELRIEIKGKDEISQLSQGFNLMLAELEANENKLREHAETDFLTGLPNRRSFMKRLVESLERLKRGLDQPSALLMLDLDFFKHINDQHGHLAGDAVLRNISTLVRDNLRKIDNAGRLGGEEFAVLLPGADLEAASHFAERLRSKVEDSPTTWKEDSIPVTISIGITLLNADDEKTDNAISRADRALYAAKEKGRNRVELLCRNGSPN